MLINWVIDSEYTICLYLHVHCQWHCEKNVDLLSKVLIVLTITSTMLQMTKMVGKNV